MNIVLAVLFWILAAYMAFGVICGPFLVGQPRKPWSAGGVILSGIVGSVIVFGLVIAALSLGGAA